MMTVTRELSTRLQPDAKILLQPRHFLLMHALTSNGLDVLIIRGVTGAEEFVVT